MELCKNLRGKSAIVLLLNLFFFSLPAFSATNFRLLVGTFSMTGAAVIPQTSPTVREILIDDATRSVKRLLEANSFNAVSISSVTEASPVTLGFAPLAATSNCYPWYSGTFLPAARAAFASQGYDYTSYDRVIYIVPSALGSACGFAGLAISSFETFYSGALDSLLVLHEFGHNFGFGHSSSDPNDDGVIDDPYGGFDCAMSFGRALYSLMHSGRKTWFTDAGGTITPVSGSGTHSVQISPVELAPADASHSQFIQITPLAGGRPYYLQFRKNSGTLPSDYNLDAFSNDRVYISRYAPAGTNILLIKDLIPGTSYTDPTNQVLIEFKSESNNIASVDVTLGDADSDSDGSLNAADTDDDNDGVLDTQDCSPTNPTRWTKFGYYDQDMDGFPTNANLYETLSCLGTAPGESYTVTLRAIDNCYLIPNDQQDQDGDGLGDACDPTDNRQGTPTVTPIPTTPPTPTSTPAAGVASVTFSKLVKGKKPKASGFALGYSSAPTVQCSLKTPASKKSGAYKSASNVVASGVLTTFDCNFGVLKRRGKYTMTARACIGSSCKTINQSITKK